MELHRRPWHPLRLPGHCGLRATTCVLVILSLLFFFLLTPIKAIDPEPEMMRPRRKVRQTGHLFAKLSESWMDHPSPPHPYATNMWWRLTNHTAKKSGFPNCYVCTQFPHSTAGDDLWPHQDHNTSTMMATMAVAAALHNERTMRYLHKWEGPRTKVTKRFFAKVATVRHIPTNLTCYSRVNGTSALGEIPKSKCNITYKDSDTNLITQRDCERCLIGMGFYLGGLQQASIALKYLRSHKVMRDLCKATCATVHVPDGDGTGVLENAYWLCGYSVYVSLPKNWTGRCALVQLHGGAMVLQHRPREIMKRKKRGLLNIVQESPVPRNHHIWNIAEKLLAFFVPGIGVASVMEEVQVTRYELISFIDTTKLMMEGIKEELRGLRLTALQNRLVLDQITASQGGVCVIVGETCCTYIPDNDAKGHVIEEGIRNLTLMSKTLTGRESDSFYFGWGWFKGFFSNVTNAMGMVIPIFSSVLLMLCVWPCVMKMIRNAVSSTFQHKTRDRGFPEDYIPSDSSEHDSVYDISA